MNTPLKCSVTKWTHPDWDQYLILEGTPEQTRKQAEENEWQRPELLQGEQQEMTKEDFDALDEFQG